MNQNLLKYNLTRKIISMFKSNSIFTQNWDGLNISDNIIDGYIRNTIIGYYNISKSKIKVELWSKQYDGRRIAYELDETFKQDNATNIDSELNIVNNEFVYSIRTNLLPNKTFFFKFILFEK
jgi:hypothetical protein